MAAEPLPRAAYRFDRFTLDLSRGVLLASDGTELPLRPKSFALLQLLVESAGHLVSRDAIMTAIWPDVFVTDDSITQCVGEIDVRSATERIGCCKLIRGGAIASPARWRTKRRSTALHPISRQSRNKSSHQGRRRQKRPSGGS